MSEKIKEFFRGRYGLDQLGRFMQILAIVFLVIKLMTKNGVFDYLALALMIYVIYRVMSKDFAKRSAENANYLNLKNTIFKKVSWTYLTIFGKDGYKFFACKNCGQELKVPKKKGKIKISCPSCKEEIVTRT